MKVRKGDYYRTVDRQVWLATSDHSDDPSLVRVIVRDAKPRRTIKPSEALAWLRDQDDWRITADNQGSPANEWCVHCAGWSAEGLTLTKAIINLRKRMGVR